MPKKSETPVIFRKWKPRREFGEEGGDIIALFPADLGTNDPYTCSSYMHQGQHSSADPWLVMQDTVPAKPEEYADLQRELEQVGYDDLRIYHRLQSSFLADRQRQLQEIEQPAASAPRAKASKPVARKRSKQSSRTMIGTLR